MPCLCALCLALLVTVARGEEFRWNQFRGPNGQGVADAAIPLRFGPDLNAMWRLAVPPGHSSPVIWGDRIFLTAFEGDRLIVLAIDRTSGKLLWRQEARSEKQSQFHAMNNRASSTSAADERHVYAFFGTRGLLCYDHEGKLAWERPLDVPPSKYGAATSPILHKELVILALDGDRGSRLLAVHRDTGKTAWEQPRALFRAGWSTPMILRQGQQDQLIVLGARRLTAYNPDTGDELWWLGGFPDETVGVPVFAEGLLVASAAALGGRGDDKIDPAITWKMTIDQFDANHDNQIQREEMTEGFNFILRPELPKDNPGYGLPVRSKADLLRMLDHDRNGMISEAEWMRTMSGYAANSRPRMVAIRPGASGDAKSHVAWEIKRGIPETPSLLHHRGRLYMVRDGGLITCLNAATGAELYQGRVGAAGQYVASPIAAANRIIVASASGVVSVLEPADELKVLARNDFGEKIFATPALAFGRLYVRTEAHLYAIGE